MLFALIRNQEKKIFPTQQNNRKSYRTSHLLSNLLGGLMEQGTFIVYFLFKIQGNHSSHFFGEYISKPCKLRFWEFITLTNPRQCIQDVRTAQDSPANP